MTAPGLTTRPLDSIRRFVTREKSGGVLLVGAASIGFVWANSPWRDVHADLAGLRVGPAALHLDLPLATWAADGLLAVWTTLENWTVSPPEK